MTFVVANKTKFFELTTSEERFFHQSQINPEIGVFNERMGFFLDMILDKEALNLACNVVIKRQEILRAYIDFLDDSPVLGILSKLNIDIDQLNIPNMSIVCRNLLCKNDVINNYVQHPFSINKAPLFRIGLIDIEKNKYLLIISMHHIISDGDPSFQILLNELFFFYDQLIKGTYSGIYSLSPPLKRSKIKSNPSLSYLYNYIKNKEKQISFWVNHLSESPHYINLDYFKVSQTLGNEISSELKFRILKERFKVSGLPTFISSLSILKELDTFSKHKLFFIYITSIVFYYCTKQTDIVFGIPIYNRDKLPDINTLGYYGGVTIIRTKIDYKITYLEYLKQFLVSYSESLLYSALPFQDIVHHTAGPHWRTNTKTPLFNVLLVILPQMYLSPSINCVPVDIATKKIPYDIIITIRINSKNDQVTLTIEYGAEYDYKKVKNIVLGLKKILRKFINSKNLIYTIVGKIN